MIGLSTTAKKLFKDWVSPWTTVLLWKVASIIDCEWKLLLWVMGGCLVVFVFGVFIRAGKRDRLCYKSNVIYPPLLPADWKSNSGGRKCELMLTFSKVQAPCNTSATVLFCLCSLSSWKTQVSIFGSRCFVSNKMNMIQLQFYLHVFNFGPGS